MKYFIIITDTYFLFALKKHFVHRLEGTFRVLEKVPSYIFLLAVGNLSSIPTYRWLQGTLSIHPLHILHILLFPTFYSFSKVRRCELWLKRCRLDLFLEYNYFYSLLSSTAWEWPHNNFGLSRFPEYFMACMWSLLWIK